jgi:hypothetical protein
MSAITSELETGLNAQLKTLADEIRATEEKLLRTKEGYLKVQGALEILAIINQRQEAADAEAIQAAIGDIGAD